ncbi:GGDEF domain-containing protein [Herbaspirillum autotrophicum]|uniref:GGDEF domain-containing protein n=1 Tax=Herbaspirillum autotrophicum TaxID=180195 RepID=UPI0018DD2A5D|nr:GGDEF domain-containing protein [Herbaspirillum autotrophicum]
MAAIQFLKNFFTGLLTAADADEQQKFFAEIRHLSIFMQWVGIAGYVGGYWLMPADNHFNATHGIWVMSGIAAGLGISIFCRTLPMLNVGSVMLILSVTSGFRGLADSVSNPAFWVLPMGAIIGMTMAPLFSSSSLYLLVSTGIWVIFGYGNFPLNPQIPGEHWPELIIGSAVVMGLSLNICFRQLRQRNHRVRRDLERLAFQDALTGMHNRRSFTERAQQMQQRKDTPSLYFLMIDIDNFKKINDAFGHDFGDQVLKKTADIIHQHAGHHLSGRLGGEEFGMVFEGDSDAVCAFAAALVRAVHGNFYPQHAVSISVGIAELISNADLAYSYKRADASLYRAKSEGKNRYVLA